MEKANAYIPMDWRQALAKGTQLPVHAEGSALFADVSGFTTLTEALRVELGPRRGAEELTVHLNNVYNGLIDTLHQYRGSVVSFSGDAITCWFDDDLDGRRAVTCAFVMQSVMTRFEQIQTFSGRIISLSLKTAVAIGPVKRFAVGLPEHMRLDVLAGNTVELMAAAEGQASKGEVVITRATAEALTSDIEIGEWREEGQFAMVTGLEPQAKPNPWPPFDSADLTTSQQEAWLLPPVLQRMQTGRGEFLSELRPIVALFLNFSGLDYEQDPAAPSKLDRFIQEIQRIAHRYDGNALQLTVGDKGSYMYVAFGAPIAHENDAVRAVSAGLEMQRASKGFEDIKEVRIGITHGMARTGAYGGDSRRTYGALGDTVNLSARLMMLAKPGQILSTSGVRGMTKRHFTWQSMPTVRVKGKKEAIAIASPIDFQEKNSVQLLEPTYGLPMVGRIQELSRIADKMEDALLGHGQVIGITAEAGLGKSRLAAEVVSRGRGRGFELFGGECQSFGTQSSYLVWQNVWRGFFGIEPNVPVHSQIEAARNTLNRLDPSLTIRLPLLAPVLNIPIENNDLTRSLSAKVRKTALENLLADCVRLRAQTKPLFIVLEDCHWIDPVSKDLVEVIARSVRNVPVTLLVVYRPPDRVRKQTPDIEHLPNFTEIELNEFSPIEADELINLKLEVGFGNVAEIPDSFRRVVAERSGGSPFYIEEILNYLRDINVDMNDEHALLDIELPASIHSLILSRIDQLSEHEQVTLRVASVIGRLFRASMLWGIYPELGESGQLENDLHRLSELELTPLDQPEPEVTYLFKHIVTQEVAYESLSFATRAELHESIGQFIEGQETEVVDQYLDFLAFHYGQSDNDHKKREYLIKAGDSAKESYANAAAVEYFYQSLNLFEGIDRADVMLKLGEVLEMIGEWDTADGLYANAFEIATEQGNVLYEARTSNAIGEMYRKRGRYEESENWLGKAATLFEGLGNQDGLAKAKICHGTLHAQQGQFEQAEEKYLDSLKIRREMGDRKNESNVLNNLGIVSRIKGDPEKAIEHYQASLLIRREINDRWGEANSLNNLGNVSVDQGSLHEARLSLEEAVTIQREIGDKWSLANALNNLGNVVREQGYYAAALDLYSESLSYNWELQDKWALAYLLEDIGGLAAKQNMPDRAYQLRGAADALRGEIQSPLSESELRKLDLAYAEARESLDEQTIEAMMATGREFDMDQAVEFAMAAVLN